MEASDGLTALDGLGPWLRLTPHPSSTRGRGSFKDPRDPHVAPLPETFGAAPSPPRRALWSTSATGAGLQCIRPALALAAVFLVTSPSVPQIPCSCTAGGGGLGGAGRGWQGLAGFSCRNAHGSICGLQAVHP